MKDKLLLKTSIAITILASYFFVTMALAQTSVWKVSKGDDHVYIGGTVHVLPVSEFPLPQEFTTAYEQSDAIVLETKLPDQTDLSFQMKMMQKMSYSNGQTLSSVLSKSTYKKLSAYIAGFGIDINDLNGFKPGFIVTMMVVTEAKKSGIYGDGVDAYFNQLAVKHSKNIEYLETADFQLDMLSNMGFGYEEAFVKNSLSQMKDFEYMFNELLSAWRKGDTNKLEHVLIKPMREDPKTFKQVIIERNQKWIPPIEKMFGDNDREFILVGVGHLIGRDSVIGRLKAKGYSVSKL